MVKKKEEKEKWHWNVVREKKRWEKVWEKVKGKKNRRNSRMLHM